MISHKVRGSQNKNSIPTMRMVSSSSEKCWKNGFSITIWLGIFLLCFSGVDAQYTRRPVFGWQNGEFFYIFQLVI